MQNCISSARGYKPILIIGKTCGALLVTNWLFSSLNIYWHFIFIPAISEFIPSSPTLIAGSSTAHANSHWIIQCLCKLAASTLGGEGSQQYHILEGMSFFQESYAVPGFCHLPAQNTGWHQHILDPFITWFCFSRQLVATFKFRNQANSRPGSWILLGFGFRVWHGLASAPIVTPVCSFMSTRPPTVTFTYDVRRHFWLM